MRLTQIVCALVAMNAILATGEDLALLAYKKKIDEEIAGYKSVIAQLQQQITVLTGNNESCTKSYNEIKIEFTKYSETCKLDFDKFAAELKKCQNTNIEITNQFNVQINNYNTQINQFQVQIDKITAEFGKCKNTIVEINNQCEININTFKKSLEEWTIKFNGLTVEFNTCQKSVVDIKNQFQVQIQTYVNQINTLNVQITTLTTQVNQCQGDSGDIKKQYEIKITELNAIIAELKINLGKWDADYKTCRKTVEELTQVNQVLTADLKNCRDSESKLTVIIKRLEGDIVKFTGQISSLTADLESCRGQLAKCSKVSEAEYKRVLALVSKYQTLLAHCRRSLQIVITSRNDFKKFLLEIVAFIDNMNLKTIKGDIGAKLTWCMTDRADFKKRITAFALAFDSFSDVIDVNCKYNSDDFDVDYDNIKITFNDYDGCVAGFKSIFQQYTTYVSELKVTVNSLNVCNNKLKEFGISLIGSARPE